MREQHRAEIYRDACPDDPDDRLLLLQLASSLRQWPSRNPVWSEALQRAADNLTALADDLPQRPLARPQLTSGSAAAELASE